jgi:DNA-binding MarR family transcriptional regulator
VSITPAPEPEAAPEPQAADPRADARWLDAGEQTAWLRLAGLLIKLPAALDAQLQRDAGLSHFEYMVLAGLSEAPDRVLRMSELAELANGSLSRLSHVVKRLEHQGWVRRAPCDADRRATNAILTDDGYAKVVATAPGHVATVRSLVVDPLSSAELAQLGRLAGMLLSPLDPDARCPGA